MHESLRLVAGQTFTGGWSYECPVFSPENQGKLISVLKGARSQDSSAEIAKSLRGQDKLVSGAAAPAGDGWREQYPAHFPATA